jgi:hypothetical protein
LATLPHRLVLRPLVQQENRDPADRYHCFPKFPSSSHLVLFFRDFFFVFLFFVGVKE